MAARVTAASRPPLPKTSAAVSVAPSGVQNASNGLSNGARTGTAVTATATAAATSATTTAATTATAATAGGAQPQTVQVVPTHTLVIEIGSYAMSYGMSTDKVPRRLRTQVAFVRADSGAHPKSSGEQAAQLKKGSEGGTDKSLDRVLTELESTVRRVAKEEQLDERKRGSLKPTPWRAEVEAVPASGSAFHERTVSRIDETSRSESGSDHSSRVAVVFPMSASTSSASGDNETLATAHGQENAAAQSNDATQVVAKEERSRKSADGLVKVLYGTDPLSSGGDRFGRKYDVVRPLWKGRLAAAPYCSSESSAGCDFVALGTLRAALGVLFQVAIRYAASQMHGALDGNSNHESADRESQHLGVVLIIPEDATRADVCEYVDALFAGAPEFRVQDGSEELEMHKDDTTEKVGVACVAVHHVSTAASFGVGLTSCVVVSVGHSGGFVACVDDGMVITESRVRLPFGGAHVTNALAALLATVPATAVDSTSLRLAFSKSNNSALMRAFADVDVHGGDVYALEHVAQQLKENLCSARYAESHASSDALGAATISIEGDAAVYPANFKVKLGLGFRLIALLGLFEPQLLHLCNRWMLTQKNTKRQDGADNLRDNWKRRKIELRIQETPSAGARAEDDAESVSFEARVDDTSLRGARAMSAQVTGVFGAPDISSTTDAGDGSILALDDAVLASVRAACEARAPGYYTAAGGGSSVGGGSASNTDRKVSADLRRRLLSAVLLTGGTCGAPGLGARLEDYLRAKCDAEDDEHRRESGRDAPQEEQRQAGKASMPLEVILGGKEAPPWTLAWKGGAVIAACEAVNELWVPIDDWRRRGSTALREKTPFLW